MDTETPEKLPPPLSPLVMYRLWSIGAWLNAGLAMFDAVWGSWWAAAHVFFALACAVFAWVNANRIHA